jgi:hypothetical protein
MVADSLIETGSGHIKSLAVAPSKIIRGLSGAFMAIPFSAMGRRAMLIF